MMKNNIKNIAKEYIFDDAFLISLIYLSKSYTLEDFFLSAAK